MPSFAARQPSRQGTYAYLSKPAHPTRSCNSRAPRSDTRIGPLMPVSPLSLVFNVTSLPTLLRFAGLSLPGLEPQIKRWASFYCFTVLQRYWIFNPLALQVRLSHMYTSRSSRTGFSAVSNSQKCRNCGIEPPGLRAAPGTANLLQGPAV